MRNRAARGPESAAAGSRSAPDSPLPLADDDDDGDVAGHGGAAKRVWALSTTAWSGTNDRLAEGEAAGARRGSWSRPPRSLRRRATVGEGLAEPGLKARTGPLSSTSGIPVLSADSYSGKLPRPRVPSAWTFTLVPLNADPPSPPPPSPFSSARILSQPASLYPDLHFPLRPVPSALASHPPFPSTNPPSSPRILLPLPRSLHRGPLSSSSSLSAEPSLSPGSHLDPVRGGLPAPSGPLCSRVSPSTSPRGPLCGGLYLKGSFQRGALPSPSSLLRSPMRVPPSCANASSLCRPDATPWSPWFSLPHTFLELLSFSAVPRFACAPRATASLQLCADLQMVSSPPSVSFSDPLVPPPHRVSLCSFPAQPPFLLCYDLPLAQISGPTECWGHLSIPWSIDRSRSALAPPQF